jgi:hypothetical protein
MTHRVAALLVALAAGCAGDEPTTVTNGPHTLSPTSVTVGVGQTTQVHVAVDGKPVTPTTYAIPDSCIARVSSGGLVRGISGGVTSLRLELSADGQPLSASVPVTVGEPAVLRLTIQSITTGSPPVPVDIGAVRGSITVVANADTALYERVDLLLAGRLVDTRPVPPDGSVILKVDTATREPTAERSFANGEQPLVIRGTRRVLAPGCPAEVDDLRQTVTLANP